jgi:hypothetical protein
VIEQRLAELASAPLRPPTDVDALHGRARQRRTRRFALVAALSALVVAMTVSAVVALDGGDGTHIAVQATSRPPTTRAVDGPRGSVIARGSGWVLTETDSNGGRCVQLLVGRAGPFSSCRYDPGPVSVGVGIVSMPPDRMWVFGAVPSQTKHVRIEYDDGSSTEVPVVRSASTGLAGFVAEPSTAGRARQVIALGADREPLGLASVLRTGGRVITGVVADASASSIDVDIPVDLGLPERIRLTYDGRSEICSPQCTGPTVPVRVGDRVDGWITTNADGSLLVDHLDVNSVGGRAYICSVDAGGLTVVIAGGTPQRIDLTFAPFTLFNSLDELEHSYGAPWFRFEPGQWVEIMGAAVTRDQVNPVAAIASSVTQASGAGLSSSIAHGSCRQ